MADQLIQILGMTQRLTPNHIDLFHNQIHCILGCNYTS